MYVYSTALHIAWPLCNDCSLRRVQTIMCFLVSLRVSVEVFLVRVFTDVQDGWVDDLSNLITCVFTDVQDGWVDDLSNLITRVFTDVQDGWVDDLSNLITRVFTDVQDGWVDDLSNLIIPNFEQNL